MSLTLNPSTKVFSVPQSDLVFISGTLYELDTNQFRKDVMDLLASEPYAWMPDAFVHNTAVTVAGTTFARTIEFVNGYSIEFTPNSPWSVRLVGSNNNIFDIENGILVQNQVQVIPTNSAGLITGGGGGSGLTAGQALDLDLIKQTVAGRAEVSLDNKTVTIYDEGDNIIRVLNISADRRVRTIGS